MTILAFANQSGGAGKTTSVTSIAALLATKHHKRVRIIDADGQRDSSHICGYTDPDGIEDQATLNDVFAGDTSFKEATRPVQIKQNGEWREIPNMSIVLGSIEVAAAERNLASEIGGEQRLRMAFKRDVEDYDVTLIDCPASLGIVMVNILIAADRVIACVKPGMKEVRALTQLEETLEKVNLAYRQERAEVGLDAVLVADLPERSQGAIYEDSYKFVKATFGEDTVLPRVRRSVKVAEAYATQKPLPLYAPTSDVAKDYTELTAAMITRGLL